MSYTITMQLSNEEGGYIEDVAIQLGKDMQREVGLAEAAAYCIEVLSHRKRERGISIFDVPCADVDKEAVILQLNEVQEKISDFVVKALEAMQPKRKTFDSEEGRAFIKGEVFLQDMHGHTERASFTDSTPKLQSKPVTLADTKPDFAAIKAGLISFLDPTESDLDLILITARANKLDTPFAEDQIHYYYERDLIKRNVVGDYYFNTALTSALLRHGFDVRHCLNGVNELMTGRHDG